MNHVNTLALSKVVSTKEEKEAKSSIPDGEYDIDMFIHVYGKLNKKTSEKDSTTSIPWLKAIAIALHKSGIQRNNILFAIEEAVKISMVMGQDEIAEMIGMSFDEMESLVNIIKKEVVSKLPKTEVIRLNPKLLIEEIQFEENDNSVTNVAVKRSA